jgi:CBS domain containing-hemolysin-like protein
MDAMNINLTIEKAITYLLSHTHTRIPVYTWTIDKIDYFVTSRDLMKEVIAWNGEKKLFELKLKEVLKVPLNQSVSMLLESLQKSYKTMAMVVDEYGWVAGLVTIEDIIEQVFWEIRDETDKESEEFIKVGENGVLVESGVLIEDVLYEFDLALENIWLDEKEFDGETVSYIITHVLNRFPKAWETIGFDVKNSHKWDGKLIMKVLDVVDDSKIWKVDVKFIENKKEKQDDKHWV